MRFGEEEQLEETRVQSTGEQVVMDGVEEVTTGRGRVGLVRGGEDRYRTDETSR